MPAYCWQCWYWCLLDDFTVLEETGLHLQREQELTKLREGQVSSLRDTQSESCLVGESSNSFMNAGYYFNNCERSSDIRSLLSLEATS